MKFIKSFLKGASVKDSRKKGFTLIEILVVIGIIAILASIVIIAINPAKQFAQARNTERQSAINSILNAIGQNIADNRGTFGGVCTTALPINTASSSIIVGTAGTAPVGAPAVSVNLACLTPTYIPSFPSDPTRSNGDFTGYELSVDGVGRVLVCAPAAAEAAIPASAPICIKR